MTALQGLPNNIMHPTRCMGLDFREGGRGRVMMGVLRKGDMGNKICNTARICTVYHDKLLLLTIQLHRTA